MTRYRVAQLGTGRVAVGSLDEVHNALTGWFVEDSADLGELMHVDMLADDIEQGRPTAWIQVELGVEIDMIAEETSR